MPKFEIILEDKYTFLNLSEEDSFQNIDIIKEQENENESMENE